MLRWLEVHMQKGTLYLVQSLQRGAERYINVQREVQALLSQLTKLSFIAEANSKFIKKYPHN